LFVFRVIRKKKQTRTSKRRLTVTQNKSLKRGYLLWMFFMSLDHKFSKQVITMVSL